VAVAGFFYGYARLGALVFPVVSVLASAAVVSVASRFVRSGSRLASGTLLVTVLLAIMAVAVEGTRFANPPEIHVRGRKIAETDPYPPLLYIDQQINLRPASASGLSR